MSANATDDSGWCSDVGLDASISVGEHASVGEGEPRRKNSLKTGRTVVSLSAFQETIPALPVRTDGCAEIHTSGPEHEKGAWNWALLSSIRPLHAEQPSSGPTRSSSAMILFWISVYGSRMISLTIYRTLPTVHVKLRGCPRGCSITVAICTQMLRIMHGVLN